MIKFLSPRNSSTEPSRKWRLNITWSKNVHLSKSNSRKVHICSRRKLLEVYLERGRHLVKKDNGILPP